MKTLETEILKDILNKNEYLYGIEPQRHRDMDNLFDTLSQRFCDCLPDELKEGFNGLMSLASSCSTESIEVGKAMGLKIAFSVFKIFDNPKVIFEGLTQTWFPIEECYSSEIESVNNTIKNYLKSHSE